MANAAAKAKDGNTWPAPARSNPYEDNKSWEAGFRANRFRKIAEIIESVISEKGECRVVDLGGTEEYWRIGEEFLKRNAGKIHIILVNTDPTDVQDSDLFSAVQASATEKNLLGGEKFDFVHSNSVIEHVGEASDMALFAENVRRLAERYYVQTPNYWFPFEPHFRFIGFQYLPERLRIEMLHRMRLGFFQRQRNWNDAEWLVRHHRLLSASQMKAFFPDAEIIFEKVFFLRKSIIAVR